MSHQSQRIYEFDPFRLDVAERILLRDGEVIQLQPKVFDLLLALVERHGRLLEKDELMKLVWPDAIVEEANLANNISILRKTLSENGERFIETVPKRGYRFVASVKKVGEENAGQVRSEQSGSQSATNEKQTAVISAESAPSRIMASAGGLISRLKLHKKSAITTASALIIAATGVSLWLFNFFAQRLSPPAPEPRLIPFTSLPGEESQPTFSPDGNQIAFVWRDEKTGRSDIYVKLIDAETRLRLTDKMTDQASHTRSHISPIGQIDLSDEVSPSWSPDGHDIAFLRRSSKSNGVYIVSALGGAERKVGEVFADDVWANYLHWAPDGKHLVIEDKDTPQEPFGLFLLDFCG